MFVPLPVPFVFQRTAPDLNAWRLKSPLALRSNSGKTFFSSPRYTSSMSARLGHPDPPHLVRCRCTCSGQRCSAHTHTYTRTHRHTLSHRHTSVSFRRLKQSLLLLWSGCSNKKKALPSAPESPDSLKIVCVKCPVFAVHSVEQCSTVPFPCWLISTPPMFIFSEHFSLPSLPSPSFPSPPLPAPEHQPPSLPN